MIVGVGIDVVDVSRIEALLERYAERFQHRVFTREEIRCCMARSNPSQHFAARFARSLRSRVFRGFSSTTKRGNVRTASASLRST